MPHPPPRDLASMPRSSRPSPTLRLSALRLSALLFSALPPLLGCGGADAGADAGATSDASADAGPALDPWPSRVPDALELGDRRGFRVARSIVHLHSPLSHDACDGAGWESGGLAAPACLEHLRSALCALHVDAAMLTDHAPHLNTIPLEVGLWMDVGDEEVRNLTGELVASRMVCPDGHRVLVTAGSENALMPLGLERHVLDTADPAALEVAYDASDPAAVTAFRDAGALVWIAHTEGQTLEALRAVAPDGLEIYNLHANVDPRIREADLGLDPGGFIADLLSFASSRSTLPPDLAVMTFLDENRPSLDRWDTLLAEGARPSGTGGCDAHENALPMILSDGERADSYRRMMLWISNHLLVRSVDPEAVDEALSRGRLYVTFEVFGTPMGFDFRAEAAGAVHEMGDDAPLGATLRIVRPSLPEGFPADPAPAIRMRLLRAEAGGAVEVAASDGPELIFEALEPGAYRAEVRMIPEHMRPYLGRRADTWIREHVWVYSNPIFVGL